MRSARTDRFAPWLLLAVVALIAYGSLYPFNFEPHAVRGGFWEAVRELSWARAGRGDRVRNVLLYIPLGFCVYLWFGARLRFVRAALVALAIGTAVSISIEIAQAYLSPRVPSLRDLALNVFGTAIGAVAGATWHGLSRLLPIPSRSEAPERDAIAVVLILVWIAWRLAPFVPRFDLQQLKGALSPLIHPELQWTGVATFLCYWLIVSHALFKLTRRQVHAEALLVLIAIVLAGRLLLGQQGFIAAELVALLFVLPGMIIFDRLRKRPTRAVFLVGILTIVAVERLFPFNFVRDAASFDLMGPIEWAMSGFVVHTPTLLQKLFVLCAAWWLLRGLDVSSRVASIVLVAFVLALEIIQLWLPARTSTVTEPLLAAVVVLILSAIARGDARRSNAVAANDRIRA